MRKNLTLPPVTYAGCTFKGSYAQIDEVVAAVSAWIEENGYEPDGSMFDIYHVSPTKRTIRTNLSRRSASR